ncbi:hypothetical protein JQ633_09790 [Bradyrhizobium tropiciagri]|uniref:hypothetical protein n=1 Tax=Bradyrhizobium tropiciagri TaxID=312253 RepID=UPI001BA94EBD|nr:hypothetical protein [Bradyrhizobium tropiciagri]MBR0870651.1 hypothetical protein [Bradyrhizobium tropiciagri]
MRLLTDMRGDAAGGEGTQTLDIVVTRDDLRDEAAFRATGVLDLYQQLFPANERDSADDIVRWVLSEDVGRREQFTLDGREISYCLDSRCFILRAAQRAIGLGFFTYDHASRLVFCNYVGVATAWRGGGLARAFYREMAGMLDALFPGNIGVALEVEPFDRDQAEAVITDLEHTGRRQLAAEEQAAIRRLLRVRWYDALGHSVFCDARTKRPLCCRSPCLDPSLPQADWAGAEEDYWLMWQARTSAPPASVSSGELWQTTVEAIYVEILAKSLVAEAPQSRRDYWHYATSLVAQTLRQGAAAEIALAPCLAAADSLLLQRWRRLAIDLAI